MNWRDTVYKPEKVKFTLKVNKEDKSLDLIIPLQKIFELQAKQSFAFGATDAVRAIGEALKEGKKPDSTFFRGLYKSWGLEDLWQKVLGEREHEPDTEIQSGR